VFAVEDRFSIQIPEAKLDPRQAGLTLESLVRVLADELARSSPAQAKAA
jgi:acyl carrier protein